MAIGLAMKLLLTRPRKQAEALASKLRTEDIDVWIEPMLKIIPCTSVELDPEDYQVLLVTSSNGADSLADVTARRDVMIYAVGDITAATLSCHGFSDVHSAGGNVNDLAVLVETTIESTAGAIAHVGGTDLAGDLVKRLCLVGYRARHVALYHTVAATSLSCEVRRAMGNGEIDGALFFSPGTARIFMALVSEAKCGGALASMTAFCLSEAVASALDQALWGRLVVSDRPASANLLAAVTGG